MSEGELIEIAQRRRKLEDAIKEADLYHVARIERGKQAKDRSEDNYKRHKNYDRWCRETAEYEQEIENIEGIREDIEKSLEACRDDMNRMQDFIRRAKERMEK